MRPQMESRGHVLAIEATGDQSLLRLVERGALRIA